jgi:deoxyribodipyrimidine photo-lyase
MTAIIWFRRDLRLSDNPALAAALAGHELVVPVFCIDERLLSGRHRCAPRAAFMGACLVELGRDLRELGSRLVIRTGAAEAELPRLAQELGADEVFAAADVSPFARRRDRLTAAALEAAGVKLRLKPGCFVVDDPTPILSGAGTPYTVFTPFYRRWLAEPRRGVLQRPQALAPVPAGLRSDRLAELGEPLAVNDFPPGEAAGRQRMLEFAGGGVSGYTELHDALAETGTSRLSPYLHFGCVSARELESVLAHGDDAEAARRQLCWRDFYAHVLRHHPGNARAEQQQALRGRISWSRSMRLFDAWREGRTGYPLVDAAMRELTASGYMHNRARLVVGSFLVKDMGIDWRWGERWFMRSLLDGDMANNNGNWQWIASVGVDPQPPSRRMFNPTRQLERFDPDGVYVRRHVPELRRVPDEYLREPWKMPESVQRAAGCVIGADYPAPILDHTQARQEAIARYAEARGSGK